MIRGAIDYYNGELIGGWIYSPAASLRDQPVLAFVDGICIGAGRIDVHRPDLAEAGLGDGYCGFTFIVSPPPATARGRIIIKLEGSDFALMHRESKVIDPADTQATGAADKADYSLASIEWMREQNWLDQTGFDFLKHMTTIGLYDRSLRTAGAGLLDPTAEVKRMFELYRQGPVRVQEAQIELRSLFDERPLLVEGAAIPIIAVHAPQGAIRLLEGSRNERRAPSDMAGATRHPCRDDRILFLDTRAIFAGEGTEPASVFRAV